MEKPTSSKDGHEYGYRPAKSPQSLLSPSSFNLKRRAGSRPLACGLPASPVRGGLGPVFDRKRLRGVPADLQKPTSEIGPICDLELPLFPGICSAGVRNPTSCCFYKPPPKISGSES